MRILQLSNIIVPLPVVAQEMKLSLERIHKLLKFHNLEVIKINNRTSGITEETFAKLKQIPRVNGRPRKAEKQ